MRAERRGELHRHVALVGSEGAIKPSAPAMPMHAAESHFSLLRLSVPARLLIVSVAAVLLWTAVIWALR
jgi:hypothetical protein